jgi:hypothetical protein
VDESCYHVAFGSPHYGRCVGKVTKAKSVLGALGTIIDVQREAVVLDGETLTVYKLDEDADDAAAALVGAEALEVRATLEPEMLRRRVAICRVGEKVKLDVLRLGPPSFTSNGPGPPYCAEVQTRGQQRDMEPTARGFVFEFVRGAGVSDPKKQVDFKTTGTVYCALDVDRERLARAAAEVGGAEALGDARELIVKVDDIDDETKVRCATVRHTFVSKADGAPTCAALMMQRKLLREKKPEDWTREEKFFVKETMHLTGEWHESNTTIQYVLKNASRAWLDDLISLYRTTKGRVEYLSKVMDVRQTEEEMDAILRGLHRELTYDFLVAATLKLGWGFGGEDLLCELRRAREATTTAPAEGVVTCRSAGWDFFSAAVSDMGESRAHRVPLTIAPR